MGSIGGLRDNLKSAKMPFVFTATPARDIDAAEKLVKRFTNGMCSNRYYENDYQNFEAMKHQVNRRGKRQLEKMRQIERARKQNRDINSLKQHKLAWRKFYEKLCLSTSRLEEEICAEMYDSLADADCHIPVCENGESAFVELIEYKKLLAEDTKEFKADVLANVAELRNDIDLLFYEQSGVEDENFEILQLKLEGLKDIMEEVSGQLTDEMLDLEMDITHLAYCDSDLAIRASNPNYEFEGIPLDLLIADFPHDNVWTSLMAEVVLMDESFKQKLRDLDVEYLHVIGNVNNGMYWEDHAQFEMIREQYQAHDTQNCHSLFIDRLKRQFSSVDLDTLMAHDRWCRDRKSYKWRKSGILKTWQQTKHQLVLKVTAVLTEASHKTEEMQRNNAEKEAQIKYCKHLIDKVNAWKFAKFEEQKLKDELDALAAERERLKTDEKLKREKSLRSQQKQEIEQFRNAKRRMSEEAEREKMQKLKEIQENLAKQAIIDEERIEFRRAEREKKLERMAEERQRRDLEKEKLQDRLEELRKQVRVEAPRDPERTQKATVASEYRTGQLEHVSETSYEPVNTQLFSVNTFNERQLKRDNRVQVENALRKAGLLNSDYARNVIQKMPPPQAPRKDTFSNIKFGNEAAFQK